MSWPKKGNLTLCRGKPKLGEEVDMPQSNCIKLVAGSLSLKPGPGLRLLSGTRGGDAGSIAATPHFVLPYSGLLCDLPLCLLGQKDRHPIGYKP